MPVHIGDLASEVAVADGDLPLSEAQLERLVRIIIERIERHERQRQRRETATALRGSSMPPSALGE
jgi:hypothetical protein